MTLLCEASLEVDDLVRVPALVLHLCADQEK